MTLHLKHLTDNMTKIVSSNIYNRTYLYGYKMKKLAKLFKIGEPDISILNTSKENYTEKLYNQDLQTIYQFYKHPFFVHRMADYDKNTRRVSNKK